MSLTSLSGSASPHRFTTSTPAGTPPLRTNSAIADGTVLMSRTSSRPARCGSSSAFSASTRCPPAQSGTNSSHTEMSKQMEVEASTPVSSSGGKTV
jgi:hypothetical protein